MDYVSILIAGFGGGAVRGLVGFIKHQYSYKNISFDTLYFIAMVFVSGVVGLLTSAAANELDPLFFGILFSPAFSFFAGYAGGDFIENLYKILFKKVSFPE